MLRKFLRDAIPNRRAREEFKASAEAMNRGFRSLWMGLFGGSGELGRITGIKVNLACGRLVREGWVNVDLYPPAGAFYVDVENGLPFGSSTVAHIHCEHFLEHLRLTRAEEFLAECCRVLVPGGTMRVIVPDAEKYIRAYGNADQSFFEKLKRLGYTDDDMVNPDLDTPIKVINQMFHMGDGHKFGWDFETLSKTAKGAGFSNVSRSCFGEGEFAIDGTDEWRLIESLYAVLRK